MLSPLGFFPRNPYCTGTRSRHSTHNQSENVFFSPLFCISDITRAQDTHLSSLTFSLHKNSFSREETTCGSGSGRRELMVHGTRAVLSDFRASTQEHTAKSTNLSSKFGCKLLCVGWLSLWASNSLSCVKVTHFAPKSIENNLSKSCCGKEVRTHTVITTDSSHIVFTEITLGPHSVQGIRGIVESCSGAVLLDSRLNRYPFVVLQMRRKLRRATRQRSTVRVNPGVWGLA